MTTTPPDPLARQHDGTTDPQGEEPEESQTQRLRDENRALRELLAAQVQASIPRPNPLKRLGWWLISAPGAALVGWRSLLGREDAAPMTGKRMGYATLTVLYTLAIYGALVLLVVSWSTPNAARSGVNAAGPVRVPLDSPPPPGADSAPARPSPSTPGSGSTPPVGPSPTDDHADPDAWTEPAAAGAGGDAGKTSEPGKTGPAPATTTTGRTAAADAETTVGASGAGMPAAGTPAAGMPAPAPREPTSAPATAPAAAPKSTLRITEIPAENPHAWVDSLKAELARCATLGFFERPGCAWAARKQFCEPNQGWGALKECPIQQ